MRGTAAISTCALVYFAAVAPSAQALTPLDTLLATAVQGILGLNKQQAATSSGYGATPVVQAINPVADVLTTAKSVLTGLANQVVGLVNLQQQKAAVDLAGIQSAANNTVNAVGYQLDAAGTELSAVSAVAAQKATGVFGELVSIVKGEYNAFQSVVDELSSVYDQFFNDFCSAPTFTPPAWVPATFSGPGFKLTLAGGNATVDESNFILSEGGFNLTAPAIIFEDVPAKFVSKYKSAPSFEGETCNLSKSFGDKTSQVLFVFDPSSELNKTDVVGYLLQQATSLLGLTGISPAGVSYAPVATAPTVSPTLSIQDAAAKLLSTLTNVIPAEAAAPAAYVAVPSAVLAAVPAGPQATATATTQPATPVTVAIPQPTAAVMPAVDPGTSVPVVSG